MVSVASDSLRGGGGHWFRSATGKTDASCRVTERFGHAAALAAWGTLAWSLVFVANRLCAPFPLDAFEDYEIYRAVRWLETSVLYAAPSAEAFPTPYPPGFYWATAVFSAAGLSGYWPGRIVSMVGFAAWLVAILLAARTPLQRALGLALVSCAYPACARFYEVARPDMLAAGLLALGIALATTRPTLRSGLAAGMSLAGAALTKQTTWPVAVLTVAAAHRPATVAAASAAAFFGAWALALLDDGLAVIHWTLAWPARHGFSVDRLCAAVADFGLQEHAALWCGALGAAVARERRGMLLALVGSATALAALGKWGAIENHLLIAAAAGSMVLVRLPAGAGTLTMAAGLLAISVAALPDVPDFRWLKKRSAEWSSWSERVVTRGDRVTIAHYWVQAERLGVPFAGFSDLALMLPGWRLQHLPEGSGQLLISTRPDSWRAWQAKGISVTRLEFDDASGTLPRYLVRWEHLLLKRNVVAYGVGRRCQREDKLF